MEPTPKGQLESSLLLKEPKQCETVNLLSESALNKKTQSTINQNYRRTTQTTKPAPPYCSRKQEEESEFNFDLFGIVSS